MYRQLLYAFLPLLILVAIPIILRPVASHQNPEQLAVAEKLVIITPHAESIRYEFTRAFQQHYFNIHKKPVIIEWRSSGGTSDIVKFIADRYESVFRQYWEKLPDQISWNGTIAANFANPAATATSKLPAEAIVARTIFLKSNVSIGIDLFFGGGQYDHGRQAERGFAIDAGIQRKHPEWFNDQIIPMQFGGETFYDRGGRYYGVCLASFGICWNYARLKEFSNPAVPEAWQDLAEPRFFNQIAIADPTKSGSVNKCFEMILQQEMHEAMVAQQKSTFKTAVNGWMDSGWANGINLIKRLTANSRYVTDSASKVPHDVATGNAAAGICIDFYGRSEAEWSAIQSGGVERMAFLSPRNGTSLSADPIQLLRGAPNQQTAVEFIEFLLSDAGQKIWNYKVGTTGGPEKYALRRMPIRRDMYQPQYVQFMSDGKFNPYIQSAGFEYNYNWTGRYFNLLRILIKCIALDPISDLQDAWKAIIKAGGPAAVPEAMAAFNRIPFPYRDIEHARESLRVDKNTNPMSLVLQQQRKWCEQARENYRQAKQLAEAGR